MPFSSAAKRCAAAGPVQRVVFVDFDHQRRRIQRRHAQLGGDEDGETRLLDGLRGHIDAELGQAAARGEQAAARAQPAQRLAQDPAVELRHHPVVLEGGQEIAGRQQARSFLPQPHQHFGHDDAAGGAPVDSGVRPRFYFKPHHRLRPKDQVLAVQRFAQARRRLVPAEQLAVHFLDEQRRLARSVVLRHARL